MTAAMTQPVTESANARVAINGDLAFVEKLLGSGAAELKYCYQCSTCTVVCPITPDESPFPRKEMIYAQFGLKEKLVSSLDAWLCIHCNDCSTHCPRGAKPADVMNVIRSMSIVHFAKPAFLATVAQTPSRIWMCSRIANSSNAQATRAGPAPMRWSCTALSALLSPPPR